MRKLHFLSIFRTFVPFLSAHHYTNRVPKHKQYTNKDLIHNLKFFFKIFSSLIRVNWILIIFNTCPVLFILFYWFCSIEKYTIRHLQMIDIWYILTETKTSDYKAFCKIFCVHFGIFKIKTKFSFNWLCEYFKNWMKKHGVII